MATDGTVKIGTELDKSGFDKGLSGLGNFAKKGAAVLAGTAAAGVAAFGAITKASLDAVAELEQNVGGVETLFKDSAETVITNANKAYKTAGMSANTYMSTVTSFSASLLQSLSGNTAEAAKVADMAIIDMSDNANKMGTSIDRIQDAYQGFAKQNYTMLDNLKLGYGGTKTEMERLLSDAQKLSGVEYDISNLNDVYQAIHVIQTELGITGTTAKEAATTIEGSMNSAKAAWDNFLAGTATAEDLVAAVGTAASVVGKNLTQIIPRLAETIPAAASLIASAIAENLPQFAEMGLQMLGNISTGITNGSEALLQKGSELIQGFLNFISNEYPSILEAGTQIITNLISGILSAMPQIIQQAGNVCVSFFDGVLGAIPSMILAGKNIISSVINGIKENLPQMAQQALQVSINFISSLAKNLPAILKAGADLIAELASGILSMIPVIAKTALEIGNSILEQITRIDWLELGSNVIQWIGDGINALFNFVPDLVKNIAKSAYNFFAGTDWIGMGKSLIQKVVNGIQSMFSNIPNKVKDIATNAFNRFKETNWSELGRNLINKIISGITGLVTSIPRKLTSIAREAKSAFTNIDWSSVGSNIINGIVGGIRNMAGNLVDSAVSAASNAINAVKGWLGINSPSKRARDEIGVNMIAGVNEGIQEETPNLEKTSVKSMKSTVQTMKRSSAADFVSDMQAGSCRAAENNEMSARSKYQNNGYDPDDPDDGGDTVIINEVNVDGEPLYRKAVRKTKESIAREQKNHRAVKGEAVVFG